MTSSPLDFERIRQLIDLFESSDLGVLDLQWGGDRLRLEAASRSAAPSPAHTAPAHTESAEATPPAELSLSPSAPPEAAAFAPTTHTLRSPIVGTFYRAPDPEAAPFVEVGDRVEPGQVVCIVEAMKLMNEIEADSAGIVVEITAGNGEAVGYDDPLLVMAPLPDDAQGS